jgi:NADP-dependent 3-hydroxy acid dehydrogenase YdfG
VRTWDGKKYWLVGASEGLGRALADVMSRAGVELVLSARNGERLEELAAELPGRARVVPMDVSDRASVEAAAAEVGQVDGVVYLAGLYWPMTAQGWDAAQAEAMADVNFTGAVRLMGAVVPGFVARNDGHVVLVGSLAGYRGLPGSIAYGASKAGVIHLAESMRADLRGTGVLVQISNPGFVRTRLTDKNDFRMPFLMEPEEAARTLFEHMTGEAFRRSYPWSFALLFRLGQFLPDWAWDRVFRRGA